MNIVTVDSTSSQDKQGRQVKFLRNGKSDVLEFPESSPWGIDSRVPAGTVAIYSDTALRGQGALLGYIFPQKLKDLGIGETRIFSTDDKGVLKFDVILRGDGTVEIGGSSDNLVRYSRLEIAYNELNDKFNAHIEKWNAFAAAYVPGGPSAVGSPPAAVQSSGSTGDISGAKIEELKTL